MPESVQIMVRLTGDSKQDYDTIASGMRRKYPSPVDYTPSHVARFALSIAADVIRKGDNSHLPKLDN